MSNEMNRFLHTVQERVIVYDGAMGTNIQAHGPTADDYWGKEGCNELLVLSRPDVIKDIHASYFAAGADVVETDTFGATRIVLAAVRRNLRGVERLAVTEAGGSPGGIESHPAVQAALAEFEGEVVAVRPRPPEGEGQ